MKGNLTIEAAYLFPFCFFILSLICYLGIFLYNHAVLELTGYECVLVIHVSWPIERVLRFWW